MINHSRADISFAGRRGFGSSGGAGGSLTSPGLTSPCIPYASAAQVLGNTSLRYDVVNNLFSMNVASSFGVDFFLQSNYSNLGVSSFFAPGSATVFVSNVYDNNSGGMRYYGSAAGGTWLMLSAENMFLLSTSGKPSAFVIAGINDQDALRIPVYIGQKSTTYDKWNFRISSIGEPSLQAVFNDSSSHAVKLIRCRTDNVFSANNAEMGTLQFAFTDNSLTEYQAAKISWGYSNVSSTFSLSANISNWGVAEVFKRIIAVDFGAGVFTINGDLMNIPLYIYGQNNSTFIFLVANGIAIVSGPDSSIVSRALGVTDIKADASGAYDINLMTNAGGRVNFAGPAVVTTAGLIPIAYVPIKINGAPYKMLVQI